MIKSNIKIAWRSLVRSKVYSSINILGLATGLASFIIILLYLNYELSYDKWDPSLKRVSRVSLMENGEVRETTPGMLASFLRQQYPNAEAATNIQTSGDYEVLLTAGDKKIYQKGFVSADSSFLKVFPYQLTKGDAATAMNIPNAIILEEGVSRKLFGNDNPIGKSIKLHNAFDAVVTGVFRTPTIPSHLNVQIIARDVNERTNNSWESYSYETYLKTTQPLTDEQLEDAINKLYYNERLKKDDQSFESYRKGSYQTALFIDKVPHIHNFPKHGSSNFTTVSVLLVLALLLLLAGAINFSNLSVAQSVSRAKEVGVRKVLGSGRRELVFQFMSETTLQCILSLCVACILVMLVLPYLNRSFNLNLGFSGDQTASIIIQIAGCLAVVILLSGLYPSLLLSYFNAAKVLKGDYSKGKRGLLFRNSLTVLQFIFSAFFIIGTIVIKTHIKYMSQKDRGFSGEQVMRIQTKQKTREQDFDATKNILLSIPGVEYVSKTTLVPGDRSLDTSTWKFKYNGTAYRMNSVKVSTDYFKTLHVALVQGRLFNDSYADQHTRTAIINETAAKNLNLSDPVGKIITFDHCDTVPVQIAGVVKDFNVHGFETLVQPVVYTIGNKACVYQSGGGILVKLNSPYLQSSVAAITKSWGKIEPDFPIKYTFLNDNFEQLLITYQRLEKIIAFFTFVAVLIAAMGLFALTAFLAGERTKEIGIRKVLGANVRNITVLLGRDFIWLVFVAITIAIPLAWWSTNRWLQTFAYRISLSWWMFVLAGIVVAIIAVVTVSMQAVKAALANPVKSLRSE